MLVLCIKKNLCSPGKLPLPAHQNHHVPWCDCGAQRSARAAVEAVWTDTAF